MYDFGEAFKYVAVVHVLDVRYIAGVLSAQSVKYPNGTSFAITTDVQYKGDTARNLWLTESARNRLLEAFPEWCSIKAVKEGE